MILEFGIQCGDVGAQLKARHGSASDKLQLQDMNLYKAKWIFLWILVILGTSCRSTDLEDAVDSGLPITKEKWSLGSSSSVSASQQTVMDLLLLPEEAVQLIQRGFEKNPDVAGAQARLEQAFALWKQSRWSLMPSVDLQYSLARTKQNFIGLPIPGAQNEVLSTQFQSNGLGLFANWELDLWGRMRAVKASDRAGLKAAEYDWQFYLLSLSSQIAKAWADAVIDERQWRLAEERATQLERVVERVKDRYGNGLETSRGLDTTTFDWLNAQQEATQRRQRVETSRRILEALVGNFPHGAESLLGTLPVFDTGVPSGLPSELLERRPDLLAASAKVEASRQRLQATERELFPRISLTGSLGTSSPELQEVLSPDYSIWQLAGNVTQPLFSRGLIRGRIALRKAAAKEELAKYQSLILSAFKEVSVALQADVLLREQLGQSDKMLVIAKRDQNQAEQDFSRGLTGLHQVVQSRQKRLTQEIQSYEMKRQVFQNRVDLLMALGGGWESPVLETVSSLPKKDLLN
ncbi:MAG: TolC family protein [Limisphaerales bacterium]